MAASTRQSDLTLDQMGNFYETINLIDPKLYMNIHWMSVFMNCLGKSLFILQEEKRTDRQNQIFQEFKKRTARAHNTMDEK
jgi:hypothetical protein